jgi:hypothetical protein
MTFPRSRLLARNNLRFICIRHFLTNAIADYNSDSRIPPVTRPLVAGLLLPLLNVYTDH